MDQAFKKLWIAVLNQAIKDVQEIHSEYAEDARAWFRSKSQATGSFIWICLILDLDPDPFRSVYHKREAVSYTHTPQNMTAERSWAFG